MKFSTVTFLLTTAGLCSSILTGCSNPYDLNACEGGRYHPPYYGTYPDSSYYDNDYYKNYERAHHGKADHRYDHTYGPNQLYHPSETKP